MSLVTCSKWIRRGLVKNLPEKAKLREEDIEKLKEDPFEAQAKEEEEATAVVDNGDAVEVKGEEGEGVEETIDDEDDEYDFKNYDNEDVDIPDDSDDDIIDEEESGSDGDEITEDDNLIVVGCFENDMELLKVYVYNEVEQDLYVHHDIMLTSCPLSLEYVNVLGDVKNAIAVGCMNNLIELWDLDVLEAMEPVVTLGKVSKKHKHKSLCHKAAVTDLSWNTHYSHILASGSADKSILLWDLEVQKAKTLLATFDGEVECTEWHMHEGETLVASAADNCVRIFDCRYQSVYKHWKCDEKVLCVGWNPWDPFQVICGTDGGHILSIDSRKEEVLWTVDSGHRADITGISLSEEFPGLLITATINGAIQLWDLKESQTLLFEKFVKVGKLCSFATNPNAPYISCVGGDRKTNNFKIVNLKDLDGLAQHWSLEDTSKV